MRCDSLRGHAMKRLSATLASILVGLVSLADAESLQHDPKQLEAQARELVSEGRALEHQGQLVEAKEKYLDAEGVAPSDEGGRRSRMPCASLLGLGMI